VFGIVAGENACANACGQFGLDAQERQRGGVSDTFGVVYPLSAISKSGPDLLQLADQDISVSVATSA